MRFHEIEMVGKFWPQEVSALPTWSTANRGRILRNTTDGYLYVGGTYGWEAITTGGNDAYISRTESDTHNGTITPSADNTINLGASDLRYSNVYAVNFQGISTTSTYADLAEKYTMDREYPVGTLLTITEDEDYEMGEAVDIWDYVSGVISDKPGVLLNADSVGQPVALAGKVPVRVVGRVYKGSFINCAGNGVAEMTSGTTGMIGIALETNEEDSEKLVMCMLKL